MMVQALSASLRAEQDEHWGRLTALKGRCPGLKVGPLGYYGPWQAVIRETDGDGETTITQNDLGVLVTRLEQRYPPDT